MPETSLESAIPPELTAHHGMLLACWAIVIVICAMAMVFLRARKKEYALAVLPLMLVPLFHILSGILANQLGRFIALTREELRALVDINMALLSCLLLGLASRGIGDKRNRNAFLLCCGGFTIILCWVLVFDIL